MNRPSLHARSITFFVGAWAFLAPFILFFTTIREMLHVRDLPAVAPEPAPHAPLTSHVLLFIPDALRYDFAVDATRAPHFARHMRDDTHAVVWTGRVTMTSAAVLAMGAGQRGSFSQIITNLNVRRVGYNDIFTNARASGLRTALAGDETWSQTFGKFDEQVVDANGIAIDVDNSAEIFAAAEKMILAPSPPQLVVAHLIAPDHQGHAHMSSSETYRRFLLKFDEDTQHFLDKVPPDWTVIALADHGQTDTGAHGTDTEIMRKTPMFAYGPGIRKGVALPDVDQVDIAYTIATLLGIPGPAHGLGVAVTGMLDVPPATAADIACAEARRVQRLAAADGLADIQRKVGSLSAPCDQPQGPLDNRRAAGVAAVRMFDQSTQSAQQSSSVMSFSVVVGLGLLGLLLPAWLLSRSHRDIGPRGVARFTALAAAIGATSVFLTFYVERITPPFHNVVRAALFVVANGAALYGLLRPSKAARFFDRSPALALALLPGALAVSYTANTQVESLVALTLGTALWLFAPHADLLDVPSIRRGTRTLPLWHVALAAVAIVALGPFGIRNDNPTPQFLQARPWLLLAASFAAILAWLAAGFRHRDRSPKLMDLAAALTSAVACVLLRRIIPPYLGITAVVLFPALALTAAFFRRFTLAYGLAFSAYAWVSRDIELLAVASAAFVVEAVSLSAARSQPSAMLSKLRPYAVATLVTLLFAAVFLVRVGLQGGLDLGNIDYGAGSFGHPDVSQVQVFGSAFWKYASATILVLAVGLRPLPASLRNAVALAFVVAWLLRSVTVIAILFLCRSSFWSAMRSLSDSPTALVITAASALVLLLLGWKASSAAPQPADHD